MNSLGMVIVIFLKPRFLRIKEKEPASVSLQELMERYTKGPSIEVIVTITSVIMTWVSWEVIKLVYNFLLYIIPVGVGEGGWEHGGGGGEEVEGLVNVEVEAEANVVKCMGKARVRARA